MRAFLRTTFLFTFFLSCTFTAWTQQQDTLQTDSSAFQKASKDIAAQKSDERPVKRKLVFINRSSMGPDTFYSVQLTIGQDSLQVEQAKTEFLNKYPDEEAHLSFEKPFYKLRSGRFQNRKEAEQKKAKLKKEYNKAFIVKEISEAKVVTDTAGIKVIQDKRIDSLIQKHIARNKRFPSITCYHVQIFSSSKKKSALKAKAKFREKFPDKEVHLKYERPYFKLRVGSYSNIWEAKRAEQQLSQKVQNTFIVKEKIKAEDLKNLDLNNE